MSLEWTQSSWCLVMILCRPMRSWLPSLGYIERYVDTNHLASIAKLKANFYAAVISILQGTVQNVLKNIKIFSVCPTAPTQCSGRWSVKLSRPCRLFFKARYTSLDYTKFSGVKKSQIFIVTGHSVYLGCFLVVFSYRQSCPFKKSSTTARERHMNISLPGTYCMFSFCIPGFLN